MIEIFVLVGKIMFSFVVWAALWTVLCVLLIKKLLRQTPRVARAFITIRGKKETKMDLKVNKKLPVALVLEDQFDNVVPAPSTPPTWTVADVSMGTVEVAADGMSATFMPAGRLGTTQLQALVVTETQTIQGLLELNLIAGDATEVILQPGTAV